MTTEDEFLGRTKNPGLNVDAMREVLEWLVSLDDDDPESPGRQDRRTVTLTRIIERAKEALA